MRQCEEKGKDRRKKEGGSYSEITGEFQLIRDKTSLLQCECEGGAASLHFRKACQASTDIKANMFSFAFGKKQIWSNTKKKKADKGFGSVWWWRVSEIVWKDKTLLKMVVCVWQEQQKTVKVKNTSLDHYTGLLVTGCERETTRWNVWLYKGDYQLLSVNKANAFFLLFTCTSQLPSVSVRAQLCPAIVPNSSCCCRFVVVHTQHKGRPSSCRSETHV